MTGTVQWTPRGTRNIRDKAIQSIDFGLFLSGSGDRRLSSFVEVERAHGSVSSNCTFNTFGDNSFCQLSSFFFFSDLLFGWSAQEPSNQGQPKSWQSSGGGGRKLVRLSEMLCGSIRH